jgi:exodeoxyribonuclease-5
MELTDRQKYALYKIVKAIREDEAKEFTMGGYAGTGKTSLAQFLVKFFPDFKVCAYTGKAAAVLTRKGIPAQTIHSLIYRPQIVPGIGFVGFELASRYDVGCKGFIVDEASMVSQEIYHDLKSFDLPIIFIGDHGQLEPIGSDFNLMSKPNVTLEEIHRNAGEIARFAEHLRKGQSSRSFKPKDDSVQLVSKNRIITDDLIGVDQVICAFNKTRVGYNAQIREALGHTSLVEIGERVMFLKNNKNFGLYNGMQGTVTDLSEDDIGRRFMNFDFYGQAFEKVWYDTKQFGREKYDISFGRDRPNACDYAYCITAHKSQGDQWDKVLVVEQKCDKWDHVRWAYTAASRPCSKLIWAH